MHQQEGMGSRLLLEAVGSARAALAGSRKAARSAQMVDCLRQHFLYSEKRPRDFLFAATEATLADGNLHGGSLTVSRLAREAAHRARHKAQRAGFEFANWDTASKTVVRAMLCAGVLLAEDGSPIPPGAAAQAALVTGLTREHRDATEAYLLEFLIRKRGDVSIRDHTALAHALFRQFDPNIPMEDLEDRVVLLIAMLGDRIVLTDDGSYAVRDAGSEPGLDFKS